jgi:heterodisulfide reductase subunit A
MEKNQNQRIEKQEKRRIGYYACQWGINIKGKVDCDKLVEFAKSFDDVIIAKSHPFLCTESGQNAIIEDIKEKKLDRIVASAWTPRTHEPIYRGSIAKTDISPYYFQMVNVREHCSWCTEDKDEATEKAKILLQSGIERAKLLEIVPIKTVPVERASLVIGGGIAGMNAALDLANQGIKVYLVEQKTTIGGRMAQLDRTFPTDDCAIWICGPKMLEVNRNENIEVICNAEVTKVDGYVGNYEIIIEKKPWYTTNECNGCGACTEVCPTYTTNFFDEFLGARKAIDIAFGQAVPFRYNVDRNACVECFSCVDACELNAIDFSQVPEEYKVKVGTIIVATGWDIYEPFDEYGYGQFENVITQSQLERILAPNGPLEGHVHRISDDIKPKEIVFIQCVGSRDTERTYCSGVCCMLALKNAKLLKEEFPDANITICYIDIRTNEKGFEEYYQRAKDSDIRMIRGKVGEITEDPETKNIMIRVYSSLTDEIIKISADLVVLSSAALPSKGTGQIAKVLNLDVDRNGFLTESHFGLMPQETKSKGIFIAGFAQGPKDIAYSVSQARAAASKVAEITSAGEIDLELIVAEVEKDLCISCGRCEKECPKGAIRLLDAEGAIVDEINCDGCGICATCCPTQAIDIRYYRDDQLYAEIKALLES